jgi:hypothetical protein
MTPSAGGNYYEVEPKINDKKQVVWKDSLVYTSGELLSETMAKSVVATLKGGKLQAGIAESMQRLETFGEQVTATKLKEAKETYDQLDASLKKLRSTQALRITLLSQLKDPDLGDAIKEFENNFPGDACFELIAFDSLFLKKDHERCLEGLKRIEKAIGDDGYIDFLRSAVYTQQGDCNRSYQAIQSAFDKDSSTFPIANAALSAANARGDFKRTLVCLDAILKHHPHIKVEQFKQTDEFKRLVESEEFAAWEKARTAKID